MGKSKECGVRGTDPWTAPEAGHTGLVRFLQVGMSQTGCVSSSEDHPLKATRLFHPTKGDPDSKIWKLMENHMESAGELSNEPRNQFPGGVPLFERI